MKPLISMVPVKNIDSKNLEEKNDLSIIKCNIKSNLYKFRNNNFEQFFN